MEPEGLTMSSGRRKTFWFDEDNAPQVGWSDIYEEVYDDPLPVHSWGELYIAIEQLTPKQQFVIRNSWGLVDGQEYSLRQIAELMGVDWTTVREHYNAAMERLYQTPPN
jgi:DNA-directed RNA polymerase specialized sigma24 family protein